jgi:hypothetical protein
MPAHLFHIFFSLFSRKFANAVTCFFANCFFTILCARQYHTSWPHTAVKQPPNGLATSQSTRFHRSRHDHAQTPGPIKRITTPIERLPSHVTVHRAVSAARGVSATSIHLAGTLPFENPFSASTQQALPCTPAVRCC